MAYKRKIDTSPTVDIRDLSLLDAVPVLSPNRVSPRHLGRLCECLERAWSEPLRLIVACPPRHGKSETVKHSIPWGLARYPEKTAIYVTYAQRLSDRHSRQMRRLAERAGIMISDDHNRIEEWRTSSDGGLLSTGVQGPITGYGGDLLVVDDPIKDREAADSEDVRESTWEWFKDVAYTRLEPGGACIVVATRWHVDDLSGRLLNHELPECPDWDVVHLRAIEEDPITGEERALWPERWPLDEMRRRRGPDGGDATWWSLYQGQPRVETDTMFRAPALGACPLDGGAY